MPKKLTINKFISKAKLIHGNKYDYSKSNYINAHTKINIICKVHGIFSQRPMNHIIRKQGCSKCTKNCKYNNIGFIKNAINVHGRKYDYSNVIYKNSKTNVNIICKTHGVFNQRPSNHLWGQICPKCDSDSKRLIKSDFIKRSSKIHGNKYDYSNVKYINQRTKVTIICSKHGAFFQTPNRHLSGNTCPRCVNIISKKEVEFLNYFKIPNKKENRQVYILGNRVDGYDPTTKTVYEFLGDYWHGNPQKFNTNDFNQICKKTYGSLYNNTLKKFHILLSGGYNIKYIWENDWNNFKLGMDHIPKCQNALQIL